MRFAGHEPGGHQAVDQSGDVARRDVQIGGQPPLGARSALGQASSTVSSRTGSIPFREITMTSQTTTPAANLELVRAGFQAFNAGDADGCMALTTPDLIINLAELPEPQHGREVW